MKTALITGTSSGFGKLSVPLFLRGGFRVIAALRGGESRGKDIFGASLGSEIADGRLRFFDLDLNKPEGFTAVAELLANSYNGRLDVLVNNAGMGFFGPSEELIGAPLRQQMDTNFFGPLELTQRLLPFLRTSQGRIIMLSSIVGRYSLPLYGAYAASKFALEAVTESLHYELLPQGVRVCLVEPGGFRTEFVASKKVAEEASRPGSLYHSDLEKLHAFQTETAGRQGDPQVVARKIYSLAVSARMPLRNLCGLDAWAFHIFARLVPDWVRVHVMERFFARVVFKRI